MRLELSDGQVSAADVSQEERAKLIAALGSGANWFYWIAGLSVLNSAIQLMGSDTSFIIGLGVTQVIDAIASGVAEEAEGTASMIVRGIALVMDLAVAGFFVLLGWLAGKRRAWPFLLGMTLYALDGLIFLLVQDWLSIGFHAFALFGVWGGYSSLAKLDAAEVQMGIRPIGPGAA